MPRPVYILCCESGSQDRYTDRFSHFNVLEKISFYRNPDPNVKHFRFDCRVVSVWMQLDGDPSDFECELFMVMPNGDNRDLGRQPFSFTETKRLFRAIIDVQGLPPTDRPGIIEFVSRIRPQDGGDWQEHRYPLIVTELDGPPD